MAKKCTKKRDACAKLLFCSLNPLLFDVPVAVAVVRSNSFVRSLMARKLALATLALNSGPTMADGEHLEHRTTHRP